MYRRRSSPSFLALGRDPPLARPPPRRQHTAVAFQMQAGTGTVDASIAQEEPPEGRKGIISLVPEGVLVPTRDEVSNGALGALKAVGIATLGVLTVFGVSTLALRSYLDINTVSSRLGETAHCGGQIVDS